MAPDLRDVVAALTDLDDTELAALIAATHSVPQTAPGLLAWIDGACDRKPNRRAGLDCDRQPPEAAMRTAGSIGFNARFRLRPMSGVG